MNCELCGLSDERFYKTEIDGAILNVCQKCSKFGRVIEEVSNQENSAGRTQLERPTEKELRIDFPEVIKEGLKSKNLTLEQLSNQINASKYELKKVLDGKIMPSEELALKLEKVLKISLFETVPKLFKKSVQDKSLSIGDVVEIKKK